MCIEKIVTCPTPGVVMGLPPLEKNAMSERKSKDPLHGVTLEMLLTRLVGRYGWEELARRVKVRCFANDPSIKSSLVFFRRTPWARKDVESLYVKTFPDGAV